MLRAETDLPVACDCKQGLFPPNDLDGSEGREGLTADWQLDLCPLHPPQLAAVVVPPRPNLTAASPRQDPIVWASDSKQTHAGGGAF